MGQLWSRLSGAVIRLGHVAYGATFLLLVTLINSAFLDNESEPVAVSLMYGGLLALLVVLGLEAVRRIIIYVIDGKKLFSSKLPLIGKICTALAVLLLASAVPVYFFIDMPAASQERARADAAYNKALSELPAAQIEAEKCRAGLETQPQPESAECRRERLGYEACMEYGSRPMCISIWDYESSCARKTAYTPIMYRSCDAYVDSLKEEIADYQLKYGTR